MGFLLYTFFLLGLHSFALLINLTCQKICSDERSIAHLISNV
jgi:hypothetical protein